MRRTLVAGGWRVTIPVLLAVGLGASSAAPGSDLRWDSPCFTADQARTELRSMLLGERPAPGSTSVVVAETGTARWSATIEVRTEQGLSERKLEGERCEDVSQGALVIVAGALDPAAISEPPAPKPAAPEPPIPVVAKPPPAAAPPRTLGVGADIFAEGGGTAGMLPGVTGWLGGGAGLELAWLRVEVGAQHTLRRRVSHPQSARVRTEVAISSAWLAGCGVVRLRSDRLQVPLCVGAEAGAMAARGRGLERGGTARGAWVAVTPHARLRWAATPWLRLGVSVALPMSLRRLTFSVDDLPGAAATSTIAGARLGLHLAFTLFDKSVRIRRREKRGGPSRQPGAL